MNLTKKTKKAGAVLGMIATIIVIMSFIIPGMLETSVAEPIFPEEHLFVDATYLLITEERNDSVDITIDLYLTNIWEKSSGKINAVAYVIEQTKNFAVYKTEVDVGVIDSESTKMVEIPVVLENSSYKVEVLLFEDSKIVSKGKITISARSKYSYYRMPSDLSQEWTIYNSGSYFENVNVKLD